MLELLSKPVLLVVKLSNRRERHYGVIYDAIELGVDLNHALVLVEEDFHLVGDRVVDRKRVASSLVIEL